MSDLIIYKLVLIGWQSVGKTSIRNVFCGDGFDQSYLMTLGSDFSVKKIGNTALQIWDLAGQAAFSNIRSNYYKGIHGGIVVFDLTDEETLHNISKWIDEMIKHNNGKLVPTIIVGNKADLIYEDEKEELQDIIDLHIAGLCELYKENFQYIETSALTGQNIDHIFEELLNRININQM